MARYFTHYWRNSTCNFMQDGEGELLNHLAGNLFTERGTAIGDSIYVVTVRRGELHLIGKVRVALITSQEEAATLLGDDPQELWEANEHILSSAATPMRFARKVSPTMTQSLRFKSDSLEIPLKFTANGLLDQQTLRGVVS